VTARVFSQRFFPLKKSFFLNSLEQRDTDSLFATIPLWYSLFGVGISRVWNGCVYNVWNVTHKSYSVRVQVLRPLCTRCVLPVGWSCWPHSTRWMYHRTVLMVDTSLHSAGLSLRVLVFLNLSLMTFQSFTRFSTVRYIVSISIHRRASASWALYSLPEYSSGKSVSRGHKMPPALNTNPEITFRQSVYYVVVHRGNIADHLLTIRIILKLGKILPQCWSGTRSLYPAWLWSFLRGARLPSDVWWLRALACTWTGTGVVATPPPLPTRTHSYRNFMSVRVVAWEQDKGTHDGSVRVELSTCHKVHLPPQISLRCNSVLRQILGKCQHHTRFFSVGPFTVHKVLFAHNSTSNYFWFVCLHQVTIITKYNYILMFWRTSQIFYYYYTICSNTTIITQNAQILLLSHNVLKYYYFHCTARKIH